MTVSRLTVLLAILAAIAASRVGAQEIGPVGVTARSAQVARDRAPIMRYDAFSEAHGASSRAPFIIVGVSP